MSEYESVRCVMCGQTADDTGDFDAPEKCECCDDTLCGVCWESRHMSLIAF